MHRHGNPRRESCARWSGSPRAPRRRKAYTVTLRCSAHSAEPRRARPERLGRILRGSLRSHLRMTEFKFKMTELERRDGRVCLHAGSVPTAHITSEAQRATIFGSALPSTKQALTGDIRIHVVRSNWFGPSILTGSQMHRAIERKIKGWSRAKKQALIRGDWSEIKLLAKRRAGKRKFVILKCPRAALRYREVLGRRPSLEGRRPRRLGRILRGSLRSHLWMTDYKLTPTSATPPRGALDGAIKREIRTCHRNADEKRRTRSGARPVTIASEVHSGSLEFASRPPILQGRLQRVRIQRSKS